MKKKHRQTQLQKQAERPNESSIITSFQHSYRYTGLQQRWQNWGIGLLITAITFLVYLPSLQNGFVNWDDGPHVYENLKIRHFNLDFLKSAFTSGVLSLWHPLTSISYNLDYLVWGLNPFGFHLTNSILHSLNTLLVFLISLHLLNYSFFNQKKALLISAVTSTLFGIHPIHVESVAWISERKDMLCGSFFLLSLLSYVNYVSSTNRKYYVISFAFFTFSVMSKPMAITLPIILLLIDYFPFRRFKEASSQITRIFYEKLPYFLLSFSISTITVIFHKYDGVIHTLKQLPLEIRLLSAVRAYAFYIYKFIFPIDLSPFYPYPLGISLFDPTFLFSLLIILFMIFISYILFNKGKPLLLISVLYYCLMLIPVIGIVQVGQQAAADRYTYLPTVSLFLLIGFGVDVVFDRCKKNNLYKLMFILIFIFIVAILSRITISQIGIWQDSIKLWTHVIKLYPNEADVAYENRGYAYEKMGLYNMAIADYKMAIKINGKEENVYINRAVAYQKVGEFGLAIQDYNKALTINPGHSHAYNNRGNIYTEMKDYQHAIADYSNAIQLNPDPTFYSNRGSLYSEMGRLEEAIADYSHSLRLNPYISKTLNDRGFAYNSLGRYEEALKDFDSAIKIDPKNATAYYNKGISYHLTGNYANALNEYGKAIEFGLLKAYGNRGTVYYILNNYERAVSDYKKAIEIDPNDAYAYYNLGLIYTDLREQALAESYLKISANLGLKQAQEHLKKLGTSW